MVAGQSACSNRRSSDLTVAKDLRHPNQLVEKSVDTAVEVFFEQLPALIKETANLSEIHVFKNGYKAKLAHDRHQTFDHPRTAKLSGGHAANSNRFVDIFLQTHVDRVFP